VQAYCKNLPSDHGQLAGIIKLNPRRRETRFLQIEVRRNLASAQRAGSTGFVRLCVKSGRFVTSGRLEHPATDHRRQIAGTMPTKNTYRQP
jgi:hypothetical protein